MENLNSGVQESKRKFILNFSLFGVILVYDQLLLPMFHIGSLPYKVSYLLMGVWVLSAYTNSKKVFKSIDDPLAAPKNISWHASLHLLF